VTRFSPQSRLSSQDRKTVVMLDWVPLCRRTRSVMAREGNSAAKTYIEKTYIPSLWVTVGQTGEPQLPLEVLSAQSERVSMSSVAEQSLREGETGALRAFHVPTIVSPELKLSPAEGLIHVTSDASVCAPPTKASKRIKECVKRNKHIDAQENRCQR
jgi:hypothetical protein